MVVQVPHQAPSRRRRPAGSGHPILVSKISAPGAPAWAVPRPRISSLIAAGTRGGPLTVVTGSPGAGKTMAVALWAAAEPGPVAWVGLDEFDNRPGVFWSYVVAALRQAGVTLPKTARTVPQAWAGDGGFLPRLTAELAVQDPPVTLVIDDLHLLTDPGILKGLEFLLRNAEPGLRLLVASRMDPQLPLHRYRLAGLVTEIRARDLAFTLDEAGLLLDQHGGLLTAEALASLNQRTEGWAAGLRMAAMSQASRPDPDVFVKELIAEDSALAWYLVDEVLNVQPPEVRELLLATSILEHVSAAAAAELTGNEQAGAILAILAHTNALVQPIGSGWYRYHTLFAELLSLKLRHEHPDRLAPLHQRAARWYAEAGVLTEAARHAVAAGDWPLAAAIVVDDLAIGPILRPGDDRGAWDEIAGLPSGEAWPTPQPHLVSAALALSAGELGSCAAALETADELLGRLPADAEPASRLTAAVIRLVISLHGGDLGPAAAAADRAEGAIMMIPDGKLAQHPELSLQLRSGRAAVELWSGRCGEAARLLEAVVGTEAASDREPELAGLLGQLALAEAMRGRLRQAAEVADQAVSLGRQQSACPAPALVALAWVHLARYELRQARSCLKLADDALGAAPDKLVSAAAYLVAAAGALAEGRPAVALQIVARARTGWSVPPWLDRQLGMLSSRAHAAGGDAQAAVSAAEQGGSSLAAAVTLAHVWAAAGDQHAAQRALAPVLARIADAPDLIRADAWLAEARLSYAAAEDARGRRALASALRLAEREQFRLLIALHRSWLEGILRRDPELAGSHRLLLAPVFGRDGLALGPEADAPRALLVEPLTDREREVLLHVSGMLNTAEVAEQMYISVNTVKTHLRNIYRKLAAAHRNEAVRRARQLQLI